MKKTKMIFSAKNFFIYFIGSVTIAFAVIMMKRSNVGLSSWDTLHFSINALTGMSFGTAVILVATIFLIFVTVANKDSKYILMFIPIVFVGYVVDLFDLYIFVNFMPTHIVARILTYILGLVLLPFGGTLLIISTFPAGVFDEAMLTFTRLFKTNKIVKVRVIMEISAVTLAIILGFIAGIQFGMVNVGTLIFSVTVGMFIKAYLKFFENVGLYTIEQLD